MQDSTSKVVAATSHSQLPVQVFFSPKVAAALNAPDGSKPWKYGVQDIDRLRAREKAHADKVKALAEQDARQGRCCQDHQRSQPSSTQ